MDRAWHISCRYATSLSATCPDITDTSGCGRAVRPRNGGTDAVFQLPLVLRGWLRGGRSELRRDDPTGRTHPRERRGEASRARRRAGWRGHVELQWLAKSRTAKEIRLPLGGRVADRRGE